MMERELGDERFGGDDAAADLAGEREREERAGVSDDIELAPPGAAAAGPVQMVDEGRTRLVTFWPDGSVSVAVRDEPWETWGPPVNVHVEGHRRG